MHDHDERAQLDIPLTLPSSWLPELLHSVRQLHHYIKQHANLRHGDLLRHLYPALAEYYRILRQKYTTPEDALMVFYPSPGTKLPSLESLLGSKPNHWVLKHLDLETQFDSKPLDSTSKPYELPLLAQQLANLWTIKPNPAQKRHLQEQDWFPIADRLSRLGVHHWLPLKQTILPNIQNPTQLLFNAIKSGRLGFVILLLNEEIPLVNRQQAGNTVWHCLADNYNDPTLELETLIQISDHLYQHTAKSLNQKLLNQPNDKGHYPLFSVINGINPRPKRAKALLQHWLQHGLWGEVTEIYNNNGESVEDTVIDRAIRLKKRTTVRLLMSLGFGRWLRHSDKARIYFEQSTEKADKVSYQELQQQQPTIGFQVALDAISVNEKYTENYREIVGTVSGKRFLKKTIVDQIYEKKRNWEISAENGVPYGRHTVLKINHEYGSVYLTLYPELPGRAYTVESFCRHLFGPGLTAIGELFWFPKDNLPIYLSHGIGKHNVQEAAQQRNINVQQKLAQLDIAHLTEHWLASFLYHPEDGKPDNYVLIDNVTAQGIPCQQLVDIDCDRAWVLPVITEETAAGPKPLLQIKTLLYCLDQMRHKLDPAIVERFINTDLDIVFKNWLADCKNREQTHHALFTENQRKCLVNHPTDNTRLIIENTSSNHYEASITALTKQLHPEDRPLCLLYLTDQGHWVAWLTRYKSQYPLVGDLRRLPLLKEVYAQLQLNTPDDLPPHSPKRKAIHEMLLTALGYPKDKPVIVSMPFPPLTVVQLYFHAHRLQRLLKKQTTHTGLSLLRTLLPTAYQFYQRAFEQADTPLDRFSIIARSTYLRFGKEFRTITSGLRLLSTQQIPKEAFWGKLHTIYDVSAMLQELRLAQKEHSRLKAVKKAWQQQNITPFLKLKLPSTFASLLRSIHFDALSPQQEQQIWQHFRRHEIAFHRLTIRKAATLTDEILQTLLKQSPNLTHLTLIDCPQLTDKALTILDQTCPLLFALRLEQLPQITRLGGTRTEGFFRRTKETFWQLPLLSKLYLENFPKLKRMDYQVYNSLKDLTIQNCPKLENLPLLLEQLTPPIQLSIETPQVPASMLAHTVTRCNAWLNHPQLLQSGALTQNGALNLSPYALEPEVASTLAAQAPTSIQSVTFQKSSFTRKTLTHWLQHQPTLQYIRYFDWTVTLPLSSLRGHTNIVTCLTALSNRYIASGSADHTIRIWDISTQRHFATLIGHTKEVTCLAVLLQNDRLASGSKDNSIRIWDTNALSCIETLKGHTDSITSLAVLPNGTLASGSKDHMIRLWDTTVPRCIITLEGHKKKILALAVLPNGNLVSSAQDDTIFVWNPHTKSHINTLKGHTDWISCLAVLPNGNLAGGSWSVIYIWDTHTYQLISTLTTKNTNNLTTCLMVLPNGQLASGAYNKIVHLWSMTTNQYTPILKKHIGPLRSLTMLSNGLLASSASNSTIYLWVSSILAINSISSQQRQRLTTALLQIGDVLLHHKNGAYNRKTLMTLNTQDAQICHNYALFHFSIKEVELLKSFIKRSLWERASSYSATLFNKIQKIGKEPSHYQTVEFSDTEINQIKCLLDQNGQEKLSEKLQNRIQPFLFFKKLQYITRELQAQQERAQRQEQINSVPWWPLFCALWRAAEKTPTSFIEILMKQLVEFNRESGPTVRHPWHTVKKLFCIHNVSLWGKQENYYDERLWDTQRGTNNEGLGRLSVKILFSPKTRYKVAQLNKNWAEVVKYWKKNLPQRISIPPNFSEKIIWNHLPHKHPPIDLTSRQQTTHANKLSFFNENLNKKKTVIQIAGLTLVPTKETQQTLYHAVGKLLGQHPRRLRQLVATHIQYNPEPYTVFLRPLLNQGETIEILLNKLNKGTVQIELVECIALMQLFNRPIVIVNSNGDIKNQHAIKEPYLAQQAPLFVYVYGNRQGQDYYAPLCLNYTKPAKDILEDLLSAKKIENKSNQPYAFFS